MACGLARHVTSSALSRFSISGSPPGISEAGRLLKLLEPALDFCRFANLVDCPCRTRNAVDDAGLDFPPLGFVDHLRESHEQIIRAQRHRHRLPGARSVTPIHAASAPRLRAFAG